LAEYIEIDQKRFVKLLAPDTIAAAVRTMANTITHDFSHKSPVMLVVLNGSFIFAADLLRQLDFPLDISFIKIKSYAGTTQKDLIWELEPSMNLQNRVVIIIEDIVDTGNTLKAVHDKVIQMGALSCDVATLFFKPDTYRGTLQILYSGLQIAPAFVIGYGLDVNGKGRNLPALYQLEK
jgi:hypoxanthine phosphoribosyltransferase